MEIINFTFGNRMQYSCEWYQYLVLRKIHFVDMLKWQIPNNGVWEIDQYDNPTAHYSLVKIGGKIVAGCRVASTLSNWGASTYMLKDASEGRIPSISPTVFPETIENNDFWEGTRFVIADTIKQREDRIEVFKTLLDGVADTISVNKGSQLITLSPPSMLRIASKCGFNIKRIGVPYLCEDDHRKYAVFQTSINSRIAVSRGTIAA